MFLVYSGGGNTTFFFPEIGLLSFLKNLSGDLLVFLIKV